MFTLNSKGEYDTYIVRYDFTAEELKTMSVADLNAKDVVYTPVDWEGKYIACAFMYSEECGPPREGNNDGGSIDQICTMVLQSSICISDGGTSSWPGAGNMPSPTSPSTPNTGNNPGQHGGGGGNPGTGTYNPNGPSVPVITTPLPGEEVEVQIVDPCVKLKEKAINLVFNNKVGQLKSPNVYALDHEKGFVETLSPYKKSIYINVEGTAMSNNISIPRSMNAIGIVHVHNNDYVNQQGTLVNTIKILSPKDVLSLINFQNNAIAQGVSYSDAYVEMLSSEGHFVIRLLEPVDSNFFTNAQLIKFNEEYKLKAVEFIENENLSSQNLQKMLLSFLKTYGLENKVALYKATNNEATQWSRVTLDPVNPNNLPINSPCN